MDGLSSLGAGGRETEAGLSWGGSNSKPGWRRWSPFPLQATRLVTLGDFRCGGDREGRGLPGREVIFRASSLCSLGDPRCWGWGGAGAGVRRWGHHVSGLIITRRLGCPQASPPYKGSREPGRPAPPAGEGGWVAAQVRAQDSLGSGLSAPRP